MKISLNNSIGLRLLRVVFGCYLVLTVVVTGVQLYLEYHDIETSLLTELNNVSHSFENGLATGLWNVDVESIESIVAGISKTNIITGVLVTDHDGNAQAVYGTQTERARKSESLRIIPFNNRQAREIALQFGQETETLYEFTLGITYLAYEDTKPELVGKLYLYASKNTVISQFADSFIIIIANALIKTLGLWIIFLIAANKMVATPLAKLTAATRDLDDNHDKDSRVGVILQDISESKHGDELHQLASSFLKMHDSILRKMDNLNTLNNFALVLTQAKSRTTVFESIAHLVKEKFGLRWARAFAADGSICWADSVADSDETVSTLPRLRDYDLDFVRGRKSVTYQLFEAGMDKGFAAKPIADPYGRAFLYLPFHERDENCAEMWFFGDMDKAYLDNGLSLSRESLSFLNILCRMTSETLKSLKQSHLIRKHNQMLEQRVAARTKALEKLNRELEHLAVHDPLTGLANRILFQDRLSHLINAAVREKRCFAVATIDLTNFKKINDEYGHDAGDTILKEVGRRFSRVLRKSDTLARMGGDEFAAIIIGDSETDYLARVIERFSDALSEEIQITEDAATLVAANIGIALFPDHTTDAELLIKYSDIAMYKAKRLSDGCTIFDPDKNQQEIEHLQFMYELEHAIDREQLELHYQPIVDLKTKNTVSLEALIRWNHPEKGMVPPDDFIPHAERNGLIMQLTEWVVEEASKQCVKWRNSGYDIVVSVNISQRLLGSKKLAGRLRALVVKNQLDPGKIKLEITETAAMEHPEKGMEVLSQLREAGFLISIDDFGTGHSSLCYLTRFPLNELKIDRSFLLNEAPNNLIVVQTIIELAHALELYVVAEGIENEEALRIISDKGGDAVQGYHLCKPNRAAVIDKWLAESAPRL